MTGRRAHPLRRARDDQGFTLIEMMVVLVAMGVLLAITVPIVSTVMQSTSRVRTTYTNVNDQLWLSTNLQRLLRAAVAPAPAFNGSAALPLATPPRTPFLATAITPTSLTFFANTGTADGPEEVKASCTKTSKDTTLCAPTATFTLALTPATAGSCPFKESSTSTTCKWKSTPRTLLSIPNVTNGDSTSAQPLFTYSYGTTTVCSAGKPSGCSGRDSTTFSSGSCHTSSTGTTDRPFATCPAGEIDEVSYDLIFNAKVTKKTTAQSTAQNGGLQTQTVSGTFVVSSTTVLYSAAVG
jgi:prepilin-type N-terminal cleavage/methylation domain-containing protein